MTLAKTLTPGAHVHVTCNTVRGQYLWTPEKEVTRKLTGIIRKYQKAHGMRICTVVAPSNHIHLLMHPRNQTQLSDFMHDVNTAFAKLAQQLYELRGRILEAPFLQSEAVDDAAILHDYRYILSNTVKENLVEDPRHWPGIHSAGELCGGPPVMGEYFDSRAYKARKARDRSVKKEDFIVRESIELTPIPQHQDLTRFQRETANRKMVQEIVREQAVRRGAAPVRGAIVCANQNPLHIPGPSNPLHLKNADQAAPDPLDTASKQNGGPTKDAIRPNDIRHQHFKRIKAKGPDARRLIREAIEARKEALKQLESAVEAFMAGDHQFEFPDACYLPHYVRAARGSP